MTATQTKNARSSIHREMSATLRRPGTRSGHLIWRAWRTSGAWLLAMGGGAGLFQLLAGSPSGSGWNFWVLLVAVAGFVGLLVPVSGFASGVTLSRHHPEARGAPRIAVYAGLGLALVTYVAMYSVTS